MWGGVGGTWQILSIGLTGRMGGCPPPAPQWVGEGVQQDEWLVMVEVMVSVGGCRPDAAA